MAETSRQLSNYHGMVSILNGLSSTVSKAFKKAWSVYPSKPHLVLLQDMMKYSFFLFFFFLNEKKRKKIFFFSY